MKWILWIFLFLLALVLIILVIPAGVSFEAGQDRILLYARVFGLKIKLYPRPEKSEKKEKKKKKAKESEKKEASEPAVDKIPDVTANETASLASEKMVKTEASKEHPKKSSKPKLSFERLLDYISFASDALTWVAKGIYIPNFRLVAHLHSDDPSKTGMIYGGVCAVLASSVPKLEKVLSIKKKDIRIYPEFVQSSSFEIAVTIMAVPVQLVIVALILLYKWYKMTHKDKAVQE